MERVAGSSLTVAQNQNLHSKIKERDVLTETIGLILQGSSNIQYLDAKTITIMSKFEDGELKEMAEDSLHSDHWLRVDQYVLRLLEEIYSEVRWLRYGMFDSTFRDHSPNASRVDFKRMLFTEVQFRSKMQEIASFPQFKQMHQAMSQKVSTFATVAAELSMIWNAYIEETQDDLAGINPFQRLKNIAADTLEAGEKLSTIIEWAQSMYLGYNAIKQNNYSNAAEYFNKAVTAVPQDLLSRYYRAFANFNQGRFDDALFDLNQVRSVRFFNKKEHFLVGRYYLELGYYQLKGNRHDFAFGYYQKALDAFNSAYDPNNAMLLYFRGYIYLSLSEKEKGTLDLETAKELTQDANFKKAIEVLLQ
jgi:tetratricopeptide (TPR) repeat protein